MNSDTVRRLVEGELSRVADPLLVAAIRRLLVPPYAVERAWDYGRADEAYPCWTVLEHPDSDTAIAYCTSGFGPSCPWGLVAIAGEYMSIGMDCCWYPTLEGAMRNSCAWDGPNPPGYEVD